MECSPWAESDGRMARGGAQQRPAAVSRGGGAPVLNSRREGAPRTRLDVAQPRAVAVSPIDASMRRIERWPELQGGGGGVCVRAAAAQGARAREGGSGRRAAGAARGFKGCGRERPCRARQERPAAC
jgi:hypothetical protein